MSAEIVRPSGKVGNTIDQASISPLRHDQQYPCPLRSDLALYPSHQPAYVVTPGLEYSTERFLEYRPAVLAWSRLTTWISHHTPLPGHMMLHPKLV